MAKAATPAADKAANSTQPPQTEGAAPNTQAGDNPAGDSQAAGFMYDTVMFLRPAVVSMDRLYRGIAHDPNRATIGVKTGMLALALRKAGEVDVAYLTATRFALARALWQADPGERARARALAEQSLAAAPHDLEIAAWLAEHPLPR
mgnify:CR=1 FL=1